MSDAVVMMITIVEMIDTVTDAIGVMIVEPIDTTTDGMIGMTVIDTGNIDEDGPNGDDGE